MEFFEPFIIVVLLFGIGILLYVLLCFIRSIFKPDTTTPEIEPVELTVQDKYEEPLPVYTPQYEEPNTLSTTSY